MKKIYSQVNPDKPRLLKLQRETFVERRQWISNKADCDVRQIVAEFPFLIDLYYVCLFVKISYKSTRLKEKPSKI